MGRNSKGQFSKGNEIGNRFDSCNQPSNPGRKPSRFKQILDSLESVGESMSSEDYKNITAKLLTLNPEELTKIAENKESPIAVILIANAISGDLDNKRIDNLEKFLDRIFGKSVNKVDLKADVDTHQQIIIQKTYETDSQTD